MNSLFQTSSKLLAALSSLFMRVEAIDITSGRQQEVGLIAFVKNSYKTGPLFSDLSPPGSLHIKFKANFSFRKSMALAQISTGVVGIALLASGITVGINSNN